MGSSRRSRPPSPRLVVLNQPTYIIHASFIFTDLSEGERQLTPRRFYGRSCEGDVVSSNLCQKRKRYEKPQEDNPCALPMRGRRGGGPGAEPRSPLSPGAG